VSAHQFLSPRRVDFDIIIARLSPVCCVSIIKASSVIRRTWNIAVGFYVIQFGWQLGVAP